MSSSEKPHVTASPAPRKRHLVRREALETASRPLLVQLLAPHRDELRALGVDIDAAKPARVEDDALVGPLYKLAVHGGRLPPMLAGPLLAFDTLATPQGRRALLDAGVVLPDTLSLADVALTALFDHADAARRARVRAASESPQKYVELSCRDGAARGMLVTDAHTASLAGALRAHFAKADHTDYVDVLLVDADDESVVEITHGSPASTHAVVDAGHKTRTSVDLRFARRDYLVLHHETGHLAVSGCSQREKLYLATLLSMAMFQRPDAWAVMQSIDLEPLRASPELAPVPGVTRACASELTLLQRGRYVVTVRDQDGDLGEYLTSPRGRELLAESVITEAVLYVFIDGRRRPLRVELRPPATFRLDGRDKSHVAIVRAFLEARGLFSRGVVRATAAEASA